MRNSGIPRLSVPKFLINGREPQGRSLEAWSTIIDAELKKVKKTKTKIQLLRSRSHQVLDIPQDDHLISQIIGYFLVILIILNVLAVIFESVETIREAAGGLFLWFEFFSVVIFTMEYIIRIWSSVESSEPAYRHPLYGRLRYAMRPLILIDLIVILPFYLSFLFGVGGVWVG